MVNYNVLYEIGSGRIQTANLATISPVPVGFAIQVVDVPEASNLFNKKIDPSSLKLVNKDALTLEGDTTLSIATVNTLAFTKRDGETQELKDEPSDNDEVAVSAREGDLTLSAIEKSFFDTLKTSLLNGAGQVKIATALAPGTQTFVAYSERLTPLFKTLTFV